MKPRTKLKFRVEAVLTCQIILDLRFIFYLFSRAMTKAIKQHPKEIYNAISHGDILV